MIRSRIEHPIPPFFTEDSRVLILGSFPSVKTRESGFFYGHPQNRFWKVIAAVFGEAVPVTIPEKKAYRTTMLWKRHSVSDGLTVERVHWMKSTAFVDLLREGPAAVIHDPILNG